MTQKHSHLISYSYIFNKNIISQWFFYCMFVFISAKMNHVTWCFLTFFLYLHVFGLFIIGNIWTIGRALYLEIYWVCKRKSKKHFKKHFKAAAEKEMTVIFAETVPVFWLQYPRQVIRLLMIKTTNQSQEQPLTPCQSPPHILTLSHKRLRNIQQSGFDVS